MIEDDANQNEEGDNVDDDAADLNPSHLIDQWKNIFEEFEENIFEDDIDNNFKQTVPKDVFDLVYSDGSEYRARNPYPDSNEPIFE